MTSTTYRRSLGTAALMLLLFTLILGIIYPVAVWGVGRAFAHNADGSFVTTQDGRVVGSRLIGQEFDDPTLFHSRPSAVDYDALDSGASNLAKTDAGLLQDVEERRATIAAEEGVNPDEVPDDAVTASASGLDPHISPEYAAIQTPRVATAHNLSEADVAQMIADNTEGRGVNVLLLNLAITELP